MTTDFNDLAETYSGTKGNLIKQHSEEPSFLAAVGDVAGLDVLDLACGDGHYTRMFKRAGARRAAGVDVAEAMVAGARAAEAAEPLGVEYYVGDVTALDELGAFDVVTAAYLFHYAPSHAALEAMMRSIAGHLRPGGRLVSVGISPDLGPAELAPLPAYGAQISAAPPLADGDPISVTIDTPHGPITFQCHHWTWPAYGRALAAAGMGGPEPHPMLVSAAGLQAYGADFWRPHLERPSLAVFVAARRAA